MNRRVLIATAVIVVLFYGSVLHFALKNRPEQPGTAVPLDSRAPVTDVLVEQREQEAVMERTLRELNDRIADPRLTLRVMSDRLAKDDKDVEALRYRAAAHFLLGEYPSAAADFDRLIPLTVGADKSWFALEAAYSYQLSRSLQTAKDRYDLAFATGADHRCITGEYHYRRGQFWQDAKDVEHAMEDFEAAGSSADLRRAYMAYENLAAIANNLGNDQWYKKYSRLADEKRDAYDKSVKR